jgi:O-antigen ligase
MASVQNRASAHHAADLNSPARHRWPAEDRVSGFFAVSVFLFFFSLLFEDAAPGRVEPSTLAGLLFITAALFHPRICFRKPSTPVLWFGVFLIAMICISLLLNATHPAYMYRRSFQIFYLLGMLYVASNIMRIEKLGIVAMAGYASGAVVLAALQLSGIAAEPWDRGVGSRVTAFATHPNQLALNFVMGALALIGLRFAQGAKKYLPNLLLGILLLVLAAAIVESGSRGGLMAMATGLIVLCFQPGGLRVRMAVISLVALAFAGFGVLVLQSPSTMERLSATVSDRNVAGRDRIYPIALEMVSERPVFGWGMAENTFQLQSRFQEKGQQSKDVHNLVLYVLTATGWVGFIPFCIGLLLAIRGAWKARRSIFGIVPLAMIMSIMVASLGLTLIQTKVFWMVLALGIAAATWKSAEAPGEAGVL